MEFDGATTLFSIYRGVMLVPRAEDLALILRELDELAEDVLHATHQTYHNALKRFMAPLKPDAPLGSLADDVLPDVDFESWYNHAKGTVGSMVGSGDLNFPVERPERVSLQLELLRRAADGVINVDDFCVDFLWVENNLNSNLRGFNQQIFRPFYRDFRRTLEPHIATKQSGSRRTATQHDDEPRRSTLIDPERITALLNIQTASYDLRKLIRLCEELNICYANSCFFAVAALTRALLDHIPPIFGVRTFSEVANNYKGAKSFRDSMQHLEGSARKIGDAHLHVQIRKKESLPNATQVRFSNDLDVLLAEIERVLS